ncbi:MAG: hypothetical protein II267_03090 [Paludibacteraceae bacterium]|nr:hypothetical protein [Paludibacteraceae bacterium]
MKQFDWKKILPYVVGIVVFIAVAMVYCAPALQGKVLVQGDVNNWKGAAQEARTFYEENGTRTWWTNSMFSGMPTYQITGKLPSGELRGTLETVGHLGMTGDWEIIGVIFAYFFGFFLMLRCFKVNPWLSIIGGFAIGFSTYFFLIIPAGHMSKAIALGYLAPVIGGFYAIFRKQYWLGAPLVTLYGIISLNLHPQMTYYIFMLIGIMACAELYIHIKEKAWKDLGIGVGVLMLSLLLVFGTKLSWFEMNQSYLKETMRGGHSELSQPTPAPSLKGREKSAGLDLDYATAWSYGVDETMTFLIPNWEGGASGYNVGEKSQLCQTMRDNGVPKRSAEQFCQQVPTYRGEKAFTSGPVYMGAIICFLFVLGLLIVPGPYKWALLIATLFSVALAWGRNMMWLTELFFNYFPMYNKFRAVESILVVAEITMPLLGILALQQIVDKKVAWEKLRVNMYIAGGVTAGLCLVFALFAGMVDVTSSYDAQWVNQVPAWLRDAIYDERIAMIKADAWRSFIFIALGFAVIFWYAWQSQKEEQKKYSYILYGLLAVLVLADMVPVNKRFFGNDHFVKAKDADAYFAMQPYEQEILQDQDPNFRVLNLATNTFNDARTSYRLKSIGGYSAAKLRRYQDLIDEHISKEMNPLMQTVMRTQGFMLPDENEGKDFPVLNMLNMKYAVMPLQGGKQVPVQNPYAMGNCWFVDEVIWVDTPDEECAMLSEIDLHKQAVADKKFAEMLDVTKPDFVPLMAFEENSIMLTSYAPNCLQYESMNERNQVAVFSEIYYPYDWHLYIVNANGERVELPLARVNYTLRAAVIPAGLHQLVMEFRPHAMQTDKWCVAILILALLLSAGGVTYPLWRKKPKK